METLTLSPCTGSPSLHSLEDGWVTVPREDLRLYEICQEISKGEIWKAGMVAQCKDSDPTETQRHYTLFQKLVNKSQALSTLQTLPLNRRGPHYDVVKDRLTDYKNLLRFEITELAQNIVKQSQSRQESSTI